MATSNNGRQKKNQTGTRLAFGRWLVAKEAITRVEVMDDSGRPAPGETILKFKSGDAGVETNPQEVVRVTKRMVVGVGRGGGI